MGDVESGLSSVPAPEQLRPTGSLGSTAWLMRHNEYPLDWMQPDSLLQRGPVRCAGRCFRRGCAGMCLVLL